MAHGTRHTRHAVQSKNQPSPKQESSAAEEGEEEESAHSSHGATDMTSSDASDESYKIPSHMADPDFSSQSDSGPSGRPLVLLHTIQFLVSSLISIFLCRFLLPASLIVINDIAAYLCGRFIGRTPLIKLSPKKTWEGFVGALIVTGLSAFLLADWMGRSPWLTCSRKDLSTGPLSCDPNPSFHSLRSWHALAYGLFASIVAPFGGFFASGFKRAFRIKDFGDSIPGHGGISDRMDCQMVMAVFSYIYYQSFIAPPIPTFVDVLNQALNTLTREQQVELYTSVGKVLAFNSLEFCFK
ncbi:hypothetical protein L7F22_000440 [Adiantum nelumboides]|nr:hypothetical protein [Adiantum nelumboides]